MAKKKISFVGTILWLTGVLVSLAIGFALIGGTLTLPTWLGGNVVAMIVGWIVIIVTAVGVIGTLIKTVS